MKPFVEVSRFEQDGSGSSFYQTGSSPSLGEIPGTFTQSLRNKDQVRLSFRVNNSTRMLSNSSSIYYLDVVNGSWGIPTRSIGDHVGPLDKYAINSTHSPPLGTSGQAQTKGSFFVEDAKGFDARGRALASGSLDIFRMVSTSSNVPYNQTIEIIGKSDISIDDVTTSLNEDYVKSVSRSQTYEASSNETFATGVDYPFMIEKVVVELPMAAGPGWFDDVTIVSAGFCTGTYNHSTALTNLSLMFNVGGPGISVGLHCQKNFGDLSVRELISSGVVTHARDANSVDFTFRTVQDNFVLADAPFVLVERVGNRGYASVGVNQTSTGFFTGTAVIPMEASVSNGTVGVIYTTSIIYTTYADPADPLNKVQYFTPEDYLSFVSGNFDQKYLSAGKNNQFLVGVNPYGRAMTGFYPSGGSVFGGDFITAPSYAGVPKFLNPFYIESIVDKENAYQKISSSLASIVNSFVGGPFDKVCYISVLNDYDFTKIKQSPYIIRPKDKLILSVSKSRPAISGSGFNVSSQANINTGRAEHYDICYVTGSTSASHDVTLLSGTVSVTLYGSYVQSGRRHTHLTFLGRNGAI